MLLYSDLRFSTHHTCIHAVYMIISLFSLLIPLTLSRTQTHRHAAVAGSLSPTFSGPTGQKNDLAIIEVALFFRRELLEAAAAAAQADSAGGGAEGGEESYSGSSASGSSNEAAAAAVAVAAEAQPVILITNDNAQLQLAKSHGLPAFKLAGGWKGLSSMGCRLLV